MPSSRYYYTEYEYEIKKIDDDVYNRISKKLEEGQKLIETADENNITAQHTAWIKSFVSFVNEIDPLGEIDTWSGEDSESLVKDWKHAQYGRNYSLHEKEMQKITPKMEDVACFQNYLAVVYSILNGTVKIVKKIKNRIPKKIDWDGKPISLDNNHKLFGSISLETIENSVFVLMPFTTEWSEYIWRKQIKSTVESIKGYSLVCQRADDLYGNDVLIDIVKSIYRARIIIADITSKNANVFYELGIAHALEKDVIIITQDESDIPFDLKRFRHCIYKNNGEGYDILQKYLISSIHNILSVIT
jgi:hypothetical protein